ncbi:hypothetical protein [Nocardioides sp.]|uniref:hypothetical protein n=1 Tax=Nocardioides sp. TaxID=35761 RepID=UPI0035ADA0F5
MSEQVTVGLPTSFHCDAVVDFMLDSSWVELWLDRCGRLDGTVGGLVLAPPLPSAPRQGLAPASPRGATVQDVRRTHSSFRLRATWDGTDAGELLVNVTTRPGGRSRVRITETGVPSEAVTERAQYWSKALSRLGAAFSMASVERRRFRQAIIVIHGIGEQRQTSSLRQFVGAVFPDERSERRFVKPDYVSPLVGANSVTVPGRWSASRPTTDVYELYWAHLMRDATIGQVYGWAIRLLLARRRNISANLRPHVYVMRGLLLLPVLAGLALLVAVRVGTVPQDWIVALVTAVTAAIALVPGVVWTLAKVFSSTLQHLLVGNILGDAARYFDTSPANVVARQAVREAGLELLDELHQRRRYGRIIVYGHSLGSVIAYDVLAHAWTRRSRRHVGVETMRTPALRAVEDLLNPRDGTAHAEIVAAQPYQHAAWQEFTDNGFDWLVSDLVTAGSPLAHAQWLLNPRKGTPITQLIGDRSMPTCPPQTAESKSPVPGRVRRAFTFTHMYWLEGVDRPRSVLVPDHGAMFAMVRWTNVFFPHTGVMSGDPVGGPIDTCLGTWIHEVPLPPARSGFLGFAHTKYVDRSAGDDHVSHLRDALELPVEWGVERWLLGALAREPARAGSRVPPASNSLQSEPDESQLFDDRR